MQWKRTFAVCAAMFASAAALGASPASSTPASNPSILLVQSANAEGSGVSSISQAFPNPNAAGNLIVALVRMSTTSQTVGVSDSSGNVYQDAVSQIQSDDGHQIHIFYAANVHSGVNTVTANFSGVNNHPWLALFEYSGVAAQNALDVTSAAQGSGTIASSANPVQPRAAGELVFAAVGLPSSSSMMISAGNGFTLESQDTNTPGSRAGVQDQIASSTQPLTGAFSLSESANWTAAIAIFSSAQLTVTTASLPQATEGTPYKATIEARGGLTPYSWNMSGSLPPGLSFDPTGVISGTPNSPGSYSISVQATDAQGNTATQSFQLQVNALAPASILLVQSASAAGSAVSNLSQSFPKANTAGNLIIAFVRMSTTWQTVQVSDTSGNIYKEATSQSQSADGHQTHIFYAANIAAGANRVTASFSDVNNHPWLAIYEYSGLDTMAPLDKTAHAEGASALASSGATQTTASAAELVFGGLGLPASSTQTAAADAGFTLLQQDAPPDNSRAANEQAIVNTAGTFASSFPLSGVANWTAVVATFLAPAPAHGQLTVTPASLDFGSIDAGTNLTQSVTVTNTGSAAASITQLTESGAGFSANGLNLPYTLAANEAATFQITFAPDSPGAYSGTAALISDAINSPLQVALKGTAAQPAQAQITVNPPSLNFGSVNTGSTSTQTVTLTNSGNADASISQVAVAGTGFSVSGMTTPYTLAAGASVALNLSFTPTAATAYSGTLTVTSNSSNSVVSVGLSGTGTQPPQGQLTSTPASVSFGSVYAGSTATRSLILSNTGNASLSITQLSVSGGAFSLSGTTTPYWLAPGAVLTVTVTFSPTAVTTYSGALTVISDAVNSPLTVSLSGTGAQVPQAQISANPASMNFAAVPAGGNKVQSLSLTNTGNAVAQINQINVSGTGF